MSEEREPCEACDGHGFWVTAGKPGKVERCEVCEGSGVLSEDEA